MSVMSQEYRTKLVELLTNFRADQTMASLEGLSDTPYHRVWCEIFEEIDSFNDDALIAESAFMRAYQSFMQGETK